MHVYNTFVSHAGSPTLKQLLKVLKKLKDWFVFGIMLNVPVPELRKIESYHQRQQERCKIDMLQYWLDAKVLPSWNEIVDALESTDQLVLAAEVKNGYLWSSTDEGVSDRLFSSLPALHGHAGNISVNYSVYGYVESNGRH